MSPTAVIFDLDGTLVQTRMASWEVFRGVSATHGLGIDEPEEFFALFDGNFYASLQRACRDEAHAAEVKAAMLDALGEQYAPWPVPGIGDVVRRLASTVTLAVMSSNATPVIRRILSDHGMALCFSHVFGGDVNESKERSIAQLLHDPAFGPGRRCEGSYDESEVPTPHDPGRTVLVTDTAGDVREALAAGIRSVGVAWGMHSTEQLVDAGAEFVALWPQELVSHLLGSRAGAPLRGACALPSSAGSPVVTTESVPCRCGSGHWSRSTEGACSGQCGGCGCGAESGREPVATATGREEAAVRSRRRSQRGRDASAVEGARPGVRIASRSAGTTTARELRAAVALTCAEPT